MALSNIGREPRREITESVIGAVAAIAWLSVAFLIAKRIDPHYVNGPNDFSPPWVVTVSFITILVSFFGPVLFFGALFLTHALGEAVCDWLKAVRIDPRPRQRY